jgi:hypothetical protein
MFYKATVVIHSGKVQELEFQSRKPIEIERSTDVIKLEQKYEYLITALSMVFDVTIVMIGVEVIEPVTTKHIPCISW